MSASAQTAVWNSALDRSEKYVLIAMADHADHLGENVRPSIGLIAWKTGYDERQVRRIVRQLEDDGVLVRESDGTGGRALATEYRIDFKALPKRPPYRNEKGGRMSGLRKQKAVIVPPFTEHVNPDILNRNPDILNRNPDIAMSAEPIEPMNRSCADAPTNPDVENLPRNGAAQILVAEWYRRVGAMPANYAKAVGQAQLLVKAGVTPQELMEVYDYLADDPFWASGFDLGIVLSQLDKFRQSKLPRHRKGNAFSVA